ncbi:MAG TPA: hypothetical protein VLL08_13355 [Kineosporiaceae bacterium]|nr:hypothetical protein [Kineosporiaceae bacterium]
MTTTVGLLHEIDQLAPAARIERVVSLARQLQATDPAGLSTILADLLAGDAFGRRLAVLMAEVAGRSDVLRTAAADPDSAVAGQALLSGQLPDAAIIEILQSGALQWRRLIYRRLRRDRRADLAVLMLPTVRERWGDEQAAALLPACDATTVAALLPELAYQVANWTTLAARHPGVVTSFAETDLAGLDPAATQRWWVENSDVIEALVEVAPAAALGLAERYLSGPLPAALGRRLIRLLGVDPARVIALLIAEPQRAAAAVAHLRLSRAGSQRLAGVEPALLATFLRAVNAGPEMLRSVLRAVPPVRRPELFDLVHAGRSTATMVIRFEHLALLPAPRRHVEARRMLTLPEVTRYPATERAVAAYLPTDEARPRLEAVIASPDPNEREDGYRLLIEHAGREYDGTHVVELLTWLSRIRNERDPVRAGVLRAVAELPFRLLVPAAVPALERLVRDTLNARDASPVSLSALADLGFRVLWQSAAHLADADPAGRVLAEWALATEEQLGGWHPNALISGRRQLSTLRRGQETLLWQYIRRPIEAALDRGQPWPLLRLAAELDRRAWPMPELQEMLGRATRSAHDGMIREAVRLWLAPPATRNERVGRLVSADPSTMRLEPVWNVVKLRRTDLLDQYVLRGERLPGRFATEGWWLPQVPASVVLLWSSGQQAAYRTLLRRALADAGLPRWSRAQTARALATVPGGGVDAVRSLIDGDDELVAEAALTGLARSFRPDRALRVLLSHLDGDRARVTVYAASRCARFVSPQILDELLPPLLAEAPKVVVRKEIAHLLEATRPPGALAALLAAWNRPDQHRDVKIAVAGSLVPFIADPRVAEALREAAISPEEHLALAVAGVSWRQVPPGERPRYATLLRHIAGHPHGPTAAAAVTALGDWFRWAPCAGDDLRARLLELDRLDVWQAAAACAARPEIWTVAPNLPAELATGLIEHLQDGPDAGSVSDRPAHQRLGVLVDLICWQAGDLRLTPDPGLRLSAVLAGHGLAVEAARILVLLAEPAGGVETYLEAAADLLLDRPVAAARLAEDLPPGDWTLDRVGETVDRLSSRPDTAAGLFAVAAVRAAGQRSGWTEPWAQRLRVLRRHAQPDIRDAALRVRTASA